MLQLVIEPIALLLKFALQLLNPGVNCRQTAPKLASNRWDLGLLGQQPLELFTVSHRPPTLPRLVVSCAGVTVGCAGVIIGRDSELTDPRTKGRQTTVELLGQFADIQSLVEELDQPFTTGHGPVAPPQLAIAFLAKVLDPGVDVLGVALEVLGQLPSLHSLINHLPETLAVSHRPVLLPQLLFGVIGINRPRRQRRIASSEGKVVTGDPSEDSHRGPPMLLGQLFDAQALFDTLLQLLVFSLGPGPMGAVTQLVDEIVGHDQLADGRRVQAQLTGNSRSVEPILKMNTDNLDQRTPFLLLAQLVSNNHRLVLASLCRSRSMLLARWLLGVLARWLLDVLVS